MVPVSGKFTPRQKEVYNAVLRVKDASAKMLLPGTIHADYYVEVGKLMTEELIVLGLITQEEVDKEDKDWPAYKKYFMHGTSHHMGLDTHDYGLLLEPMQAGMVFTVEPGIYIPDEGFGIRIEDDYVIQESGDPINLMANIPITVEEIENLMTN
jgi:Xaa-Pro aminopeptidase